MRTFFSVFLVALLMIPVTAARADNQILTIIHVNDSHSNLTPYADGKFGGIARAARVIEDWQKTAQNPLLIHAGDLMVGTLMFNTYFGVPELQILNGLGFDAMCLGNHEFDLGPDNLRDVLTAAGVGGSFKILCSNAQNLSAVPGLSDIVRPYAIKEYGKLKVGILGVTTPAANIESNPAPVVLDGLTDPAALVTDIMTNVAILKEAGCQIVVMVSHLGFPVDLQIAAYLTGVDVIVGGHTHTVLSKVVYSENGIPIVQAGEYYRYVGKLRLAYDGKKTRVLTYTLEEITDPIRPVPVIQETVEALKIGVAAQYEGLIGNPWIPIASSSSVLTYLPTSLLDLQTPIGKLVTGAMKNYVPDADCAIEATGHLAENLYPGSITPADLFRVYPYGFDPSDGLGFRIATFKLYGAQLAGVLDALVNGFVHPEIGDFQYVVEAAGMTYDVVSTGTGLHADNVLMNGNPIDLGTLYKIVGSDRLLGYLSSLFGITPTDPSVFSVSVFKVLEDFVKSQPSLGSSSKAFAGAVEATVPQEFALMQNYPNPFNPSTTIRFILPRASFVTLKLYNVLGGEVATLVSGELSAGEHAIVWNAGGVASGAYFYRLSAGSLTALRRLTLLR